MDNSERNLYIVTNIYRAKFGGVLEALGQTQIKMFPNSGGKTKGDKNNKLWTWSIIYMVTIHVQ